MKARRVAALWLLTNLALAATAVAQDRLRGPLDRNRMSALKGHVHPLAVTGNDQGAVDPDMPIRQGTLLFKPAASIDAFLAAQQTPSSPDYH